MQRCDSVIEWAMNIVEISDRFPRELDAIEFFESHRWGGDPVCPYCHSTSSSARTKDHRFKCYNCAKTFSVTVNTHLHDTRLPLKKWLFAFSIIADAKKGVSAMQLQRNLSVSYPTAFKMYHTIREIMAADNRHLDESGRMQKIQNTIGKSLLKNENRIAKARLKSKQPAVSAKPLVRISGENQVNILSLSSYKSGEEIQIPKIETGPFTDNNALMSVLMKDISDERLVGMIERAVYDDESMYLENEKQPVPCINKIIDRVVVSHKKLCSNKGVNTNTIESFWTAIKRQIIGQHHHITARHFPKYVSETVFKFLNRREDEMFEKLVRQSMEESNKFKFL